MLLARLRDWMYQVSACVICTWFQIWEEKAFPPVTQPQLVLDFQLPECSKSEWVLKKRRSHLDCEGKATSVLILAASFYALLGIFVFPSRTGLIFMSK